MFQSSILIIYNNKLIINVSCKKKIYDGVLDINREYYYYLYYNISAGVYTLYFHIDFQSILLRVGVVGDTSTWTCNRYRWRHFNRRKFLCDLRKYWHCGARDDRINTFASRWITMSQIYYASPVVGLMR